MMFAIDDPINIGVILATMLTIIYLYYYCFCLQSRDQTKIERARYGKNRKSVEEAVEEQRHKAGVIADFKKELDRALAQVSEIYIHCQLCQSELGKRVKVTILLTLLHPLLSVSEKK